MGTALWGLCKSVADSFWSWNREVQRRASRLALGQRKGEMPYDGRPSSNEPLCPSSLSDRRLNLLSFIECFKIVFDLNNLRFWDYFELASNFKLLLKIAKFNCYKQLYFFYSTCAQMGRLITPVTDVVHAEAANLQIISILLEFDSAFEFTLWSLQCFAPPPSWVTIHFLISHYYILSKPFYLCYHILKMIYSFGLILT